MKKIFALFASLLLVFSCSKMDEPEITPDTPDENTSVSAQSFSASLEIPTTHPKSKTTLSANGDGTYKICWENGDVITVTGGSNTAYYSTTSTTTTADFTLKSGTEPTSTPFRAYYSGPDGKSKPVAYNPSYKRFEGSTSYMGYHDVFFCPMYAQSNTTSLSFFNICGVLRLSLSGTSDENISRVVISADQPIAGAYTLTNVGGVYKASVIASGSTRQEINIPTSSYRKLSEGLILYIPLPENSYTNFKIVVLNEDKTKNVVKTSKGAISIERNKVSSITLTGLSFSTAFDGSGTQTDPYQIKTEADVRTLSDISSASNFGSKYFKVMNDITLTKPHKPFSLQCKEFDGNGKTITISNGFNLSGTNRAGFFSSISANSYGDIVLKDLTVSGTVNVSGVECYGSIAAFMGNPCIISNCTSNVNVTIDNTSGNTGGSVGGIAGYDSNENYCKIENCQNTGNITVEGGGFAVGGIAAYMKGSVIGCSNSGNISVNGNGLHRAGGILGNTTSGSNSDVAINNCYNTGNVTTYSNSSATSSGTYAFPFMDDITSYAGGIVGKNQYFSIMNCYNTGNVTATRRHITSGGTTGVALAGGITGYNSTKTVQNCYNLGTITAQGGNGIVGSSSDKFYQPFAGGISAVGGVITNCYNGGDIITKSYASDESLNVTEYHDGGIIGLKYTQNSTTYGAATNCYSITERAIIGATCTISTTSNINKDVFPTEPGSNCSMFTTSLTTNSAVTAGGTEYPSGSALLDLLNAGQASLGSGFKTWKNGTGSPAYPVFND